MSICYGNLQSEDMEASNLFDEVEVRKIYEIKPFSRLREILHLKIANLLSFRQNEIKIVLSSNQIDIWTRLVTMYT